MLPFAGFNSDHRSTLASEIAFSGTGIHSGRPARILVRPASSGGIRFLVHSKSHGVTSIPASWKMVTDTRLSTTLSYDGTSISTVEHLLAALAGLGVTDAEIDAFGPEIPIMDGSALPFATSILATGIRSTGPTRNLIRILEPIEVSRDGHFAALYPTDGDGLHLDVAIDFPQAAIGRQEWRGEIDARNFLEALAPARTFGFIDEMNRLQASGLALGATMSSAIGLREDGSPANPEGLRFPDELVRHKALDIVGDLSLAGARLAARYVGRKPGHAMNLALLSALFSRTSAWRLEEAEFRLGLAA